jgi:hypothetical protein
LVSKVWVDIFGNNSMNEVPIQSKSLHFDLRKREKKIDNNMAQKSVVSPFLCSKNELGVLDTVL